MLVLQPHVRLLLDRLCNFLIAPIDIDDGSNINSDKMKDGHGRSFRIGQKAKSKLPPCSFPTTPPLLNTKVLLKKGSERGKILFYREVNFLRYLVLQ